MSTPTVEAEILMTPAEVAAMFRVDPKTATRWAKAGKLTSIRTLGGIAATGPGRSTPCSTVSCLSSAGAEAPPGPGRRGAELDATSDCPPFAWPERVVLAHSSSLASLCPQTAATGAGEEVLMNTRTIAVAALVIAVLLLLFLVVLPRL